METRTEYEQFDHVINALAHGIVVPQTINVEIRLDNERKFHKMEQKLHKLCNQHGCEIASHFKTSPWYRWTIHTNSTENSENFLHVIKRHFKGVDVFQEELDNYWDILSYYKIDSNSELADNLIENAKHVSELESY